LIYLGTKNWWAGLALWEEDMPALSTVAISRFLNPSEQKFGAKQTNSIFQAKCHEAFWSSSLVALSMAMSHMAFETC
jgi:hypothetical protein